MSSDSLTIDVLPAHRFHVDALVAYLRGRLEGVDETLAVSQFQGGQSNPTFLLRANEHSYVLRKKPPGKLLPSAHQIEREYRVLAALANTDVSIPRARLLCEDASVIGTPFYVMEHLPGRVLSRMDLAGVPTASRKAIYEAMVDELARLHRVDWRAVGLGDFGRPEGYVERQVARWSAQYLATQTGDMPAMHALMAWLAEQRPVLSRDAIAHGDFRLGNLIFHAERAEVLGILDWELATIGHPLADLAYCCMPYVLPADVFPNGLHGLDLEAAGLPGMDSMVSAYIKTAGDADLQHWPFFVAFSLFRSAAIAQGVFHRALQGNAVGADASEFGRRARQFAEVGWQVAQRRSV